MDASHLVRNFAALCECLRDFNLRPGEFAAIERDYYDAERFPTGTLAYVTAERLAGLVEAIKKKDRAMQDQILRCWGIR